MVQWSIPFWVMQLQRTLWVESVRMGLSRLYTFASIYPPPHGLGMDDLENLGRLPCLLFFVDFCGCHHFQRHKMLHKDENLGVFVLRSRFRFFLNSGADYGRLTFKQSLSSTFGDGFDGQIATWTCRLESFWICCSNMGICERLPMCSSSCLKLHLMNSPCSEDIHSQK